MTEEDLRSDIKDLYETNRREYEGHQYIVPSPQTYPYQWLWDSCFHAVVLSHFDTDLAKAELTSLFSKQFEDGMIPHIIYWQPAEAVETDWGKQDAADIAWGKDGVSSITQPPMCAYAVWRIYQADGDESFLEDTYKTLYHFYQYLLNRRDPHSEHLIGIIHPDESGEDNSPRFDELLGLPPNHSLSENFNERMDLVEQIKDCNFNAPFCMRDHFWVKDVPFNCIMVKNLAILSRIADTLNHSRDARYFQRQRDLMADAMKEHLQGDDGVYYSTVGENYEPIDMITWAIFMPLFAEIIDKDEAQRLVDEYLHDSDQFGTAYPVPTLPKNHQSFESKRNSMWRGPTWVGANWFMYRGLKQYDLGEAAADIKHSSRELVRKSGFAEYYDPETGVPLGGEKFTWGGLVLDMQ
jgi:glycogen debranching enzyme